jgi:hypothetical protein
MLARRRSSAYVNGVLRRATLPPPIAAWAAIPLSILLAMLAYPALLRPSIAALRTDAERGDADAMFRLSERLRERGDCSFSIGAWDGPRSLRWLMRSAELGHSAATYRLGEAYEHGDGVPLDLRAAYDCYRRAEKLGVTTARYAADAIGRMLDPAVRREVERVLGTR